MRIKIGKNLAAVFSVTIALCLLRSATAETTELIARGRIEADAVDKANETMGGIGSGLAYDPKENVVVAVSDRGPGDGTVDYCPRFDVLRVNQSANNKSRLNVEVVKT